MRLLFNQNLSWSSAACGSDFLKVVWLRIGNCSVEASAQLIRAKYIRIHHFHNDEEAAVLTLP